MVDRVIIEEIVKPGRSIERLVVRIVWADDHEDTVLDIELSPHAHQLIEQLAAKGTDLAEIVRTLNAKGLATTQGNPWTRDTVSKYVRSVAARKAREA